MGLKSRSSIFQKLWNIQNDVLINAVSEIELEKRVQNVLQHFKENDMTIHVDKSILKALEWIFLGHKIL